MANSRKKHFILFYTLNALAEANNGTVEFNTKLKKAYIENDILYVEYVDGNKMLADDAPDADVDAAIMDWRMLNPEEFMRIIGL